MRSKLLDGVRVESSCGGRQWQVFVAGDTLRIRG